MSVNPRVRVQRLGHEIRLQLGLGLRVRVRVRWGLRARASIGTHILSTRVFARSRLIYDS